MARAAFTCIVLVTSMLAGRGVAEASQPSGAGVTTLQAQDDEGAAAMLAAKHAPIAYVRSQETQCSGDGEIFFPAPVEVVLGQENILLRQTTGGQATDVRAAPRAGDLGGKDDTFFLDFPGDPRVPRCTYEDDFRRVASKLAAPPTAYAHIAREDGHDGFALQYWFFYYFNDWNNRHEGDWEMIQLVWNSGSVTDALSREPVSVAYSQHGGGETADWGDDKLRKEDGRPVTYVAKGSHANQFTPDIFLGLGEDGTGFGCDRANAPHTRFDTQARLVPSDPVTTGSFGWITFEGRWGQSVAWEFNGPTGPNMKQAWDRPFTWQDRLRDSSTQIPGRDAFGANAIDGFCGIVTFSGQVLGVYKRWPVFVGVAGGLLLLGGGYMGTSIVRDAAGEPAMERPYRLRRRRTFGQILRASARLYRTHLTTFIGISLMMIPLSLIVGVIASLLFSPPSLESLTVVLDRYALLALTLSGAAATVTLVTVVTAAIAAMAQIERRERPSVVGAYGEMLRNLWALFKSRVRALVIVALLSISIVGIPFAVNRAVRWYFVEEAVLIDRFEGEDALRRSSASVRGHWWRTLGLTLLLVGILALTAPLVAAVLLLLTSTPLPMVNAIGSAIYALLLPFTGIALTLLYFDLQERQRTASAQLVEPAAERTHRRLSNRVFRRERRERPAVHATNSSSP